MKKTLLSLVLGLSYLSLAQTPPQLPNSGFESWENIQVGAATIQEPEGWSGLKTMDDISLAQLSPDGTLTQDVGRDGTGFSVRLETIYTLGVPANGGITTGRFHAPQNLNPEEGYIYTDSTDSRWNYPCSWRPDSLVGWYKYEPTGNDQGKIEVLVHDGYGALPLAVYDDNMNLVHDVTANKIGSARYNWTTSTNGQWVRFSVPFSYLNNRVSTHFLVIATAGDSTISEDESKVWIDDLELVYNNLSVDDFDYNKAFTVYYANGGDIYVNMESKSTETYGLEIIDLTGKVVSRQKMNSNSQTLLNNIDSKGIYFCRVNTGNKIITRKIVIR